LQTPLAQRHAGRLNRTHYEVTNGQNSPGAAKATLIGIFHNTCKARLAFSDEYGVTNVSNQGSVKEKFVGATEAALGGKSAAERICENVSILKAGKENTEKMKHEKCRREGNEKSKKFTSRLADENSTNDSRNGCTRKNGAREATEARPQRKR